MYELGSFGCKQHKATLDDLSKKIYLNSVHRATEHEQLLGWVQAGELNRGCFQVFFHSLEIQIPGRKKLTAFT